MTATARRVDGDVSRLVIIAGALVALGHVALFWTLDALPFQDLPNHFTRAAIMVDLFLHHGQRYGADFVLEPQLSPYLGGDVILAALVAVFGPRLAGPIWVILVAAAFPLALAVYLRVTGYSRYSILLGFLLAIYLTTDSFFLWGFQHFRLGLAVVMLMLAAWDVWLRKGSTASYVAWTGLVAAGYLVHLTTLVIGALGAGIAALVAIAMRQTSWWRAIAGAPPVAVLLAWQATSERGVPERAREWGVQVWELRDKIAHLLWPYYRFGVVVDGALLLGLGLVCVLLVRRGGVTLRDRRVAGAILLALALLAVYAVTPSSTGPLYFLDVRALAPVAGFVLIAALAAAERAGVRSAAALWIALAMAVVNLGALAWHLPQDNRLLRGYREMAARIPAGARVLPIVTHGMTRGHTSNFIHAGSFVTLDTGAYTPYLFNRGATPYFGYRTPPVRPVTPYWYINSQPTDPSAGAMIAANFQYVLAQVPFDRARLPVATEVVAQSDTAMLLRIVPDGPP